VRGLAYARNKTITTMSAKKTPFEKFWNESHNIQVDGCVAYMHVPKHKGETWSPTAKRCVCWIWHSIAWNKRLGTV
jgi:hypothetical protein